MSLNRYSISFIGLILFHLTVLLFLISDISISYKEALIFFQEDKNILSYIVNISSTIFGQNDFSLRVPFLMFYMGSAILMYLLTNDYFKSQRDRLINLAIFMILPGVNSAALVVNESIIVIFFTLLYIYFYKIKEKNYYLLLVLFLFIDNSFAILFLALFFYSIKIKENMMIAISLILFGISMSMYGFDIGAKPQGYFLDTFGIYATIFSPVLFLYFFYAIYRIGIKYDKDIFWYISMTAFGLSLIFSLRQRIEIEDFAPFVVIAIPIMVKLFIHSLRIRLKEFRKMHYLIARVALVILVLNFAGFVFNKYFYLIIENPKKHFAYKYHIAKELANKLKSTGITAISIDDKSLMLRLKFYGIGYSDKYYLTKLKNVKYNQIIEVNYHNKVIEKFYIIDL
ncbi:MAG: hypothetical protein U9N59_06350 [Campylobacterota bacterium]|nr:hypothetical protein [Campylobacterota bacterium]